LVFEREEILVIFLGHILSWQSGFGQVEQLLEQPKVDFSGVAAYFCRRVVALRIKLQGPKREICSTKIKLAFGRKTGPRNTKRNSVSFCPDLWTVDIRNMVVPLIAQGFWGGLSTIPYAYTVLKTIPWIALVILLKIYFEGSKNRSERVMHGKVVIVTVSDVMAVSDDEIRS
jgi:hypothetical protein